MAFPPPRSTEPPYFTWGVRGRSAPGCMPRPHCPADHPEPSTTIHAAWCPRQEPQSMAGLTGPPTPPAFTDTPIKPERAAVNTILVCVWHSRKVQSKKKVKWHFCENTEILLIYYKRPSYHGYVGNSRSIGTKVLCISEIFPKFSPNMKSLCINGTKKFGNCLHFTSHYILQNVIQNFK